MKVFITSLLLVMYLAVVCWAQAQTATEIEDVRRSLQEKCVPFRTKSKNKCEKRRLDCPGLKWVNERCRANGRRVNVQGCFRRGWCKYQCRGDCSKDSNCYWNSKRSTCILKNNKKQQQSKFKIQLEFLQKNLPQAQKKIFRNAAKKWEKIITKGMPTSIQLSAGETYCQITLEKDYEIRDLLVFIFVESIDGPGGILAQTGVCGVDEDDAARLSLLRIDSSDYDAVGKHLPNLILHEMGHTIGLGALWDYLKFITPETEGTPITYNRPGGIRGNKLIHGPENGPIVEDDGGRGTARSHWKESIYKNEIMTGVYDSNKVVMSAMTVHALKDLGFKVDLKKAASFRVPPEPRPASDEDDLTSSEDVNTDIFRVNEQILNPEDIVVFFRAN